MLDTLGIYARRFGTDAERAQERLHNLVPFAADASKFLAFIRQKHAAIGSVLNHAICSKPLEHLRDRRLRHPEP
ncbi:hypothetical protein SAMN02982922_0243 [Mesorhizobium australicum]|uniref:Uncharacterized protein n=1 Tax=Mesorhizobium australicum TaxID=536018 RepID=A0A1X7MQM5_9HYPH|nr:hypothetical protein SAMN02982922_0243 [Mesorhizobium australicum]